MSRFPRRKALSTFTTVFRHRLLLITAVVMLGVAGAAISRSFAFKANFSRLAGPSTASGQGSPSAVRSKDSVDLLKFAGLRRSTAPSSPRSMLVPTVTASKTDSLFTDVDGDTQADPGDTLKYTVNISASGEDATGVTFTDTVDPNTAFVGGSLTATPVAVDDSYSAIGNIRISVPAPGVLGNDFLGVPNAAITAPPSTSANGGNVTLNADGSFTYNPPAGFEGTDTFSYTLTNSAGSNSATVTITVSGMIWFINNNASCPCDGRLTNPFNSLASFQAVNNGAGNNPAANDNIFVYESATAYVGPVTLLSGQRFIGQDATASLSAITGLTPPAGSDPLPVTNSGNATIVNITSVGTAITVASGNSLIGFTGGDAGTDISGTGFGTLTISDVTLNGIGQALDLTTGTLAATFGSISSVNSSTGISLTGVAGSLTTPTTTITDSAGIGISVNTSSATLDFGTTTSTGSGGTGVSLLTNTGAISFGTLTITPDANQRGLLATDNSMTLISTGGAISTSGAVAVEITRGSGTTPLIISLASVSANGGTSGIILTNTSGSFNVTGTSAGLCGGQVTPNAVGTPATITTPVLADCTGGSILNSTSDGVSLNNATNVSLTRMRIQDAADSGIFGNNVTGFSLISSWVESNGDTTAAEDSGLEFQILTGTNNVTNSTISNSFEHSINWQPTSGTGTLNISGTTIGPNPVGTGANGVHYNNSTGTVNSTVIVTDSNIDGNQATGFSANVGGTSTQSLKVANTTVKNNNIAINISGGNDADTNFNVLNNTIVNHNNFAIGLVPISTSTNNSQFQGSVSGNVIGDGSLDSGSRDSFGIRGDFRGDVDAIVSITNNTISNTNIEAIFIQGRLDNDADAQNGKLDMTVTGNDASIPDDNSAFPLVTVYGSRIESLNTFNVCLNFGGSATLSNDAVGRGGFEDWRLRQLNTSTFRLERFVGNGTVDTDVESFMLAQNPDLSTADATHATTYTGVADGTCRTPVVLPALMATSKGVSSQSSVSNQEQATSAAGIESSVVVIPGEGPVNENVGSLRQSELSWMVQAAVERWREAGISAEDLMRLQAVTFEIGDLPEGQLAAPTSTGVKMDKSGAPYGWYLDLAPMEDSEFDVPVPRRELQTTERSRAFGRMDLLTVVMRELGRVYLQGKERIPEQLRPLMQNTLSPAVRRLPDSRNIQLPGSPVGGPGRNRSPSVVSQTSKASALRAKTGASRSAVSISKGASSPRANKADGQGIRLMNHAARNRTTSASLSSMLADVMLNIGTLPAGESVTITFNVTVDDPFTGAMAQVSNQGTVSGSNFADVLTDDPDVGGTADPTVTPIDSPEVTVAVSPTSVLEDGETNLVYTFTRNGSTANAMTVNFSVGGTASFTEPDYTQTGAATFTATSGTVVIPSGSSTTTVTIDPSADTTVEPDETVDITVTSGTGYTVGTSSSASGTIANDDASVSVVVSPGSVAEDGATKLVYTFTRTGVTSDTLAVDFSVGGSAGFPTDYSESGATAFTSSSGKVTFAADSSTATVTVDPEADGTVEPDETVVLTVISGSGYNVGSPSAASGTITNDDADISVAVAPASVVEDGGTNLVYTFTRTGFTGGALTVNFSVGGSASFPTDYSESGATTFTSTSGTVTFGSGNSTATVTVNPEADATPEPDETVIITLAAGVGYNIVNPTSATGTILNDDTLVSVVVAPSSTAEGGANLVYTFTRTGPTGSALAVNFSVGGTASFPADYTQSGAATFAPPTATVNFGAGNSTATVNVTPLSDCTVEGPETVIFTVTPGTGYGVGSPSSASGTITNTAETTPPVISNVSASPDTLTPPNHTMRDVTINYSATDNCGGVTCAITNITSNEPVIGSGSGNTAPDWEFVDEHHVRLRAEREGSGSGRVYTITITCTDSVGNTTTSQVTVTVP